MIDAFAQREYPNLKGEMLERQASFDLDETDRVPGLLLIWQYIELS
ncbi:hypothetical protein SAMN05518856_101450 [Paenibacillus sp. OK003]|nr:hypothetical protein SAMN05518856_101450 [Paenibacillus sp. OK003]